jgi:hypothetical protein
MKSDTRVALSAALQSARVPSNPLAGRDDAAADRSPLGVLLQLQPDLPIGRELPPFNFNSDLGIATQ